MIEHARRAQIFAERLQQLSLDVSYPGLPVILIMNSSAGGRSEYGFGGLLTLDVGSRVAEGLMEDLRTSGTVRGQSWH